MKLENGRSFGFRREALYPDELHINGTSYDLRQGRVIVLRDDGTSVQFRFFPALAVARDPKALRDLIHFDEAKEAPATLRKDESAPKEGEGNAAVGPFAPMPVADHSGFKSRQPLTMQAFDWPKEFLVVVLVLFVLAMGAPWMRVVRRLPFGCFLPAASATGVWFAYEFYLRSITLAGDPLIRVDLFLIIPVALVAWLTGLTAFALRRRG